MIYYVVLDTNIIVSAHLNEQGLEAAVLLLVFAGKIKLCVTQPILDEYADVLHREKFHFDSHRIVLSLTKIRSISRKVRPRRLLSVCPDPNDNRFLECAEAARADFLITGNKRHFPKQWGATKVVNAREFLEIITPELGQEGNDAQ
jgi:putative PIN family toxin of toxin-antitoxin system